MSFTLLRRYCRPSKSAAATHTRRERWQGIEREPLNQMVIYLTAHKNKINEFRNKNNQFCSTMKTATWIGSKQSNDFTVHWFSFHGDEESLLKLTETFYQDRRIQLWISILNARSPCETNRWHDFQTENFIINFQYSQ